ncbi:MAG: aspartyl-tRNA(Asn)/glutamyl-tRNA(Gln) amidotransferase subunit C [Candidatus Azotimanducaceae bacterium]|jgi:aspartyl-tRNA(Asn)/glutamyl-tRNA(Gln) amidotransferase subunit C
MIVNEKVVDDIAELALLEISPDLRDEYISSMDQILNLVEEMQSADTEGIEPMSNPLDGIQTLRQDCITEFDQRSAFQENAPLTEDGFYLVPKVIE